MREVVGLAGSWPVPWPATLSPAVEATGTMIQVVDSSACASCPQPRWKCAQHHSCLMADQLNFQFEYPTVQSWSIDEVIAGACAAAAGATDPV